MPSPFERVAKSILGHLVKKGIDRILKDARREQPSPVEPRQSEPLKNHPWRLCPLGESWVRTHPLTVPASSKKPKYKTVRNGHCRENPGGKEIYTTDELREVVALYFQSLANDRDAMPVPDALGFSNGNKYDLLIAGWTRFWNEILKPDSPLTPDFVKALIATESSFKVQSTKNSKEGTASGLIQVTEKTRHILRKDPGKELRDHFIDMSAEEAQEPEINIAAGVRWLHHKRNLLKKRLKREVTWEEAGWEYKGIFKDVGGKNEVVNRIVKDLRGYYQRLRDQRKTFALIIIPTAFVLSGAVDTRAASTLTPPLSSSELSSSKGIVIHKRTQYFIDLEAPVELVWVGCDKTGPTRDSNSGMMFYVLDGSLAYEFHYRSVDTVSMCLKREQDYRRMMQGAKTVRFIGIHPHEEFPSTKGSSEDERPPKRFSSASKTLAHIFIRMQVSNRCQAYFSEDCKLPENYWGGTVPEPIKK